ncbi:MAG: ribonuclease H-like YkuK family protein [Candidatus Pacebacteria bacterium]|nr:ribonuclease H-like YkuK family protein [Candidatus Paceibacterota bacterium]NUQ57428.1 hypothetical protein [Candidatus Paceibacter sp.]
MSGNARETNASALKFYSDTLKKHIGMDEVVKHISSYMKKDASSKYKITVGTDSEGVKETHFVTAIAVIKIGNGGRYFWARSEREYCPTLQDRIYKETIRSIVIVQELKDAIKRIIGNDFLAEDKITVHLDVGLNGPTKELVDSVVGMVRGYGFETAIKPYSYGASVLADRHT